MVVNTPAEAVAQGVDGKLYVSPRPFISRYVPPISDNDSPALECCASISRSGDLFYVTNRESFEDDGRTWKMVPSSPWGADSPFKVLIFINMGQAYALNQDGYLYGLGIGDELASPPRSQHVYLTRVPIERALDYTAYEYFTDLDESGNPRWSAAASDAAPLDGLRTMAQAAAFYHPGAGRYLFLSGPLETDGTGGLFEAAAPWGPWHLAATFPAGFIPGIIPKDAGADTFYFTAAGGGSVTYNLNIGQIQMSLKHPSTP